MHSRFTSDGYLGPVHVLDAGQCRTLLNELRVHDYALVPDWHKGLAVSSPGVLRIATEPAILNTVKTLLGNDVMLWGAEIVKRKAGQVHPWHNDIETSVAEGRTVSVWIGLEHTTADSSLEFIAGSHAFRQSIQEVRHSRGINRTAATAEVLLQIAHEQKPDCAYVRTQMHDGDVLFFDGWLWHASHNTGTRTRTALLLQYATPDTPIRMPDPNNFEWPFRILQHPKPPCIMVSGSDHFGVNRIVPGPVSHDGQEVFALSHRIYTIPVPLALEDGQPWKPHHIFKGSTPNLQSVTCHVSALRPGHTPHPPHHHREEEILILLQGEAEVTLPDLAAKGLPTVIAMKPGEVVYYPAWFYHTITARGSAPANYLMFKWYNGKAVTQGDILQYSKFSVHEQLPVATGEKKFYTKTIFKQHTDCLHALQCHTSMILPGGGYAMHSDAHDVAIVTISGEIESLGERVGPHTVLFFSAGQAHDMHNPGSAPAHYLVFEFHGNHAPPVKRKRRTLWTKLRDPKSWRQKWAEVRRRIRG